MIIELKHPVSARVADCKFHLVKAGTYVNYSCRRNGTSWVHEFTFSFDGLVHTYIEVLSDRTPPTWL